MESKVLKWLVQSGYNYRAISIYLGTEVTKVAWLFKNPAYMNIWQLAVIIKLLENDKKHSIGDILRSLFLPHTNTPEVTDKLIDLYKVIELPELPKDVPKYRIDIDKE
ncbi:MAG TPA: hypothetical protein VIS27_03005 [Yeosuana sp.]